MAGGAEAAQLDALAVLDLLGVTVAPLDGDLAVGIGVDEHVEGAAAVQLRQEGHARGDLAENGGDLGLDLRFGLVGAAGGRGGGGGACQGNGEVSLLLEPESLRCLNELELTRERCSLDLLFWRSSCFWRAG